MRRATVRGLVLGAITALLGVFGAGCADTARDRYYEARNTSFAPRAVTGAVAAAE